MRRILGQRVAIVDPIRIQPAHTGLSTDPGNRDFPRSVFSLDNMKLTTKEKLIAALLLGVGLVFSTAMWCLNAKLIAWYNGP